MKKKTGCCKCKTELSERELLKRFGKVLGDYVGKEGALIPALQIAQGMFGYLPDAALKMICAKFNKPLSEVAGVVGFYSFFSRTPRGKHLVRICLGTACYVRGGKLVLEAVRKYLGIDVGETTPDGMFTLEVARCFGACGLAPVIMVDEEVHQRVRPARVREVLDLYRVNGKRSSGTKGARK